MVEQVAPSDGEKQDLRHWHIHPDLGVVRAEHHVSASVIGGTAAETDGPSFSPTALRSRLALLCARLAPHSFLLVGPVSPGTADLYREISRLAGRAAVIRHVDAAGQTDADPPIPAGEIDLLHVAPDMDPETWRQALRRDATIIAEAGPTGSPAVELPDGTLAAVSGGRAHDLLNSDLEAEPAILERLAHEPETMSAIGSAPDLFSERPPSPAIAGRVRRSLDLFWHSRTRPAVLGIVRDLRDLGDGRFRRSGPEPILRLEFPDGRPAAGWAIAEVSVSEADAAVYPALLAVTATGNESVYYFSITREGRSSRLLRLPDDTVDIRLSPSARPTRFRLQDMRIHEVGILQIVLQAFRRDPSAVLRSLGLLCRRRSQDAKLALVNCFASQQPDGTRQLDLSVRHRHQLRP